MSDNIQLLFDNLPTRRTIDANDAFQLIEEMQARRPRAVRSDGSTNAWSAAFSKTNDGEANERWGTPPRLFEQLRDLTAGPAGFVLDACAEAETAKAPLWLGPTHHDPTMRDCLDTDWSAWTKPGDWVWMNPVYGRAIGRFVDRAHREVLERGINLVLLPLARTDTRWWHDHVLSHASRLIWVRGRVRFVDPETRRISKAGCPAPTVAVVYEHGSLGDCRSERLVQA